jgi:fibronectin-binding autotransporter adhesin
LETGYHRDGLPGPIGAGGFDADTGYDLLTVVLHEIGHVLGIHSQFPPQVAYPIDPQYLGGASGVLVAEGEGGHLAGDDETPGFLLCNACATAGGRYYPSATDVLVIATESGINDVFLARVGRISSGMWHEANGWIGGDVPGFPQDVYITHGGTVTLGADASSKDLLVDDGSSLAVQNHILSVAGRLDFAGAASVSVAAGGFIYANDVYRGATDLVTAAGSTVVFNSYQGGASASANFNGNVGVGNGSGTDITFDPSTIKNWTIGGALEVGVGRSAHFVIDGAADMATDVTSAYGLLGSGSLAGSSGRVTINGSGSSWTVNGALDVRAGSVDLVNDGRLNTVSAIVGGSFAPAYANVDTNALWDISGDLTVGPAMAGDGQGVVTLRNSGNMIVDGNVTVRGTSTRASEIHVRSDGTLWVHGTVTVEPNGVVTYHDSTFAYSGIVGAQTFDNLGAASDSGAGGITRFTDDSIADRNAPPGTAHFTNHPGNSTFASGGVTEFRNSSSAGSARFDNLRSFASIYAGGTRFFDFATAAEGSFYNEPGPLNAYAYVEFNGDSTGANGTFVNLPGVLGQSVGGAFIFNDRSKAGYGSYTSQGEGGSVTFNDFASADHGTFSSDHNIGGNSYIRFNENSTADHGSFTMRTNTVLTFYNNSTAADAQITAQGGVVSFSGDYSPVNAASTTAGNAQIVLEGGTAFTAPGGQASFSTWSTAGNATITAQGGTVAGAGGGTIAFDYSSQAGSATLIANGGVNGGAGGAIYFRRAATGDYARIIVNSGGVADFGGNRIYGGTSVGSIEGAGTFALNGSELTTGNLNTDTTVSGAIVDVPGTSPDGRLTKVGAGTLTLAGNNTYSGLTKVNAGTLVVNGAIAGPAEVNSGATLKGAGTIASTVTVNAGGTFAPGNSPGTITIGSLAMTPGGILDFELGTTAYDRIVATGNAALAGILNVSLLGGFTPAAGNSFNLLDWSSTTGSFNTLNLAPLPSGLFWDTSQLYTAGVLSVVATLPGDFNQDSVVDAADYVAWSKGGLTAATPENYNLWRTNFGSTSPGSGASTNSATPEPASWILLVVAGLVARFRVRRASSIDRSPQR